MSLRDHVSTKKMKVIYDEYTRRFYTESMVESLERQRNMLARLAEVKNKSEEARLNFSKRQVNAARNMFEMRNEKEVHQHKENLKDHVAHMHVLESLAKEREERRRPADDLLGRYGPGTTRPVLDDLIVQQLREMSPVMIRRRKAEKLLSKRRKLEVYSSRLKTSALFRKARERRSQSVSPLCTPAPRKSTSKLILPPITVNMTKDGKQRKITETRQLNIEDPAAENTKSNVFVTQTPRQNSGHVWDLD
ncbi:hypothetical protein CHS0354_029715 [Potamilus streckersoni]|uniref:Uncharacterized protein n=1 Tax=Potamilus streckersoni TaxID=2493646 RepID=A0AAE0VJR9_9BIVA|nr:hypothetical protein CHS0354_029715 [Potamilus streckersoni]